MGVVGDEKRKYPRNRYLPPSRDVPSDLHDPQLRDSPRELGLPVPEDLFTGPKDHSRRRRTSGPPQPGGPTCSLWMEKLVERRKEKNEEGRECHGGRRWRVYLVVMRVGTTSRTKILLGLIPSFEGRDVVSLSPTTRDPRGRQTEWSVLYGPYGELKSLGQRRKHCPPNYEVSRH